MMPSLTLLICVARPAPPSMLQTSLRWNSRFVSVGSAPAASGHAYVVSSSTPNSVSMTLGGASEPPDAGRSVGTSAVGARSSVASAAISET